MTVRTSPLTARTERLRRDSLDAIPSISSERARITTAFYKQQLGRHSTPVLRALNFFAICDQKSLWMAWSYSCCRWLRSGCKYPPKDRLC